jgi:hypothetical protein
MAAYKSTKSSIPMSQGGNQCQTSKRAQTKQIQAIGANVHVVIAEACCGSSNGACMSTNLAIENTCECKLSTNEHKQLSELEQSRTHMAPAPGKHKEQRIPA